MYSTSFTGDFNTPDICWSSLTGSSAFSNSLCDFVYEANLSQLINCPTHKGNTPDLVLTNTENYIIPELLVSEPHPLIPSDHLTVSLYIKHSSLLLPKKSCTFVFDYAFDGLCDHLLDTDFSEFFH